MYQGDFVSPKITFPYELEEGRDASRVSSSLESGHRPTMIPGGYPVTVGASVFGLKFKDGVMFAADSLASYGKMARYMNVKRLMEVNKTTVVGCTGDMADFQELQELIMMKQREEGFTGGGINMKPKPLHSWMSRKLYAYRSKFTPCFVKLVVGGIQDGQPFLGGVDMLGTPWIGDQYLVTGLGAEYCQPLLLDELKIVGGHQNLSREAAIELLKKCMSVTFMRDCAAGPMYYLCEVTSEGTKMEGPIMTSSNWEPIDYSHGYQ